VSDRAVTQIDAAALASLLAPGDAVAALRRAFTDGLPASPLRHRHALPADGELLLMPAWDADGIGIKVVSLHPGRATLIDAWYVLMDPDGRPLAMIDGAALTELRTAAVSALATEALARADAATLLVFGAGTQARGHVAALRATRPIERVLIVSRSPASSAALVSGLREAGCAATAGTADDVARADIVCTCTTASTPLFDGRLLAAGAHVNAVGSHHPARRELDAATLARGRVVVETRESAFAEAGELLLAEREGHWRREQLDGDLADVLAGRAGRRSPAEITVFKSVGVAAEDLVVARAALERL
jgi:ornithine cyclodeaminase